MTDRQIEALDAAVNLFTGGLDTEEALQCFRTLQHYILNSAYQGPVNPVFQLEEFSD